MASPEALEAGLIRDARRGSTSAFESLVRREQGLIRGFLRRLTSGDAALADDLSQETFVLAWRRMGSYEGKGSFRGWLCKIAYTAFLQDKRASRRAQARDDSVIADAETSTDGEAAANARLDLDRALAVLSPEQRAVMALCFGEGLSQSEAADALGLPLGTVKSHVIRGREKVLVAFGMKGQAA